MGLAEGFLGQVGLSKGEVRCLQQVSALRGGEPWHCGHTLQWGPGSESLLKLSLLSDSNRARLLERKQVVLPRFQLELLALTICLVGHAWWG